MSALTPHIRSHRSMYKTLIDIAEREKDRTAARVIGSIAVAHRVTAETLEAEERALYEKAMRP